jgi:hypothetical protein
MKTKLPASLASVVLLGLFGLTSGFTAPGLHAEDSPQGLVSELYQSGKGGKSPFDAKASRKQLGHYFTKELVGLVRKDMEQSRKSNEVGVLDFDPLYGAQDMDIKALSVNKAVTANGRTTVPVSFTNFGKKQAMGFDLVQEDGAWKISDIHYADGSSLLKLFKEAGVKR